MVNNFVGIWVWGVLVLGFVDCQKTNFVPNLQVSTKNGIVQGRTRSSTDNQTIFYSFQGIPFAQPPVGNLRFRAPQPVQNWTGILDATKEGPFCVELRFRKRGITTTGIEDCLYLNVYTPKIPEKSNNLSVLVWIYGGAFIEGNSNLTRYGPELFLNEDIIVVTFNYRLGALGFLSTESMEAPGNNGLKDQNFVLKWIHENILNFGGNPNNVAIFGQSAGSSSVFYHMQSPKSKGLFHRAIAHSGSSLSGFALKLNPRELFYQMAEMLDIESRNVSEIMTQLRNLDLQKLKKAQKDVSLLNFLEYRKFGLPFSPNLEPYHSDAFVTKAPYEALSTGDFSRVPLLVGLNSLESIVFKFVFQLLKPVIELLYDNSPGLLAMPNLNSKSLNKNREFGLEILNHYFESKAFSGARLEEIYNLFSDDSYLRPTHKSVQLMSKYIPVYFYVFSYEGQFMHDGSEETRLREKGEKGVAHTDELFYLWNTRRKLTIKSDLFMSKRMVKMWSNFIKFGNPTPTEDPLLDNTIWPPAKPDKSMLHLEIKEKLRVTEKFRNQHVRFWEYLYKKYGQEPFKTY